MKIDFPIGDSKDWENTKYNIEVNMEELQILISALNGTIKQTKESNDMKHRFLLAINPPSDMFRDNW